LEGLPLPNRVLVIQEISGHRNARIVAGILRSPLRPSEGSRLCTLYPYLHQKSA